MPEKTLKEKVEMTRNILYKMSKHVGEGWIGEIEEALTALEERVEALEEAIKFHKAEERRWRKGYHEEVEKRDELERELRCVKNELSEFYEPTKEAHDAEE